MAKIRSFRKNFFIIVELLRTPHGEEKKSQNIIGHHTQKNVTYFLSEVTRINMLFIKKSCFHKQLLHRKT